MSESPSGTKRQEWRTGLTDVPYLLVVGGPNGSGKTTVALEYSSETGFPYIGADAIAASLNPADPAAVRVEASRQFMRTVDQHISQRQSFVAESTLSGRTFRNRIVKATEVGFRVTIAFLFVDSADVCIARVAERVRKGGHDVPEHDIRRRYYRSIDNFWMIYRELADSWVLLYNGDSRVQDVAVGSKQQIAIRDVTLHSAFIASVESKND